MTFEKNKIWILGLDFLNLDFLKIDCDVEEFLRKICI